MSTTQLTSGTELGRYELLVPVAKGGMAQVWAGRLRGTRGFSKLVAIKTILPGGIDNTRLEQMFLEEASLAAQFHHPNVVETLELGEHEGTLYLVMEWVEGESLDYLDRRASDRGGLPLGVVVHLVGQVCRGLHAAHELSDDNGRPLGLVHRDISPQNILVTYTGSAKLVDFGIAKATACSSTLTEAGELKGKVAYMAPEQVKGQIIDRRTDVFALGVLLYSLTTGRHPFRGAHPAETIRRLCLEEAESPAKFIDGYPAELAEVVLKSLRKDANERFASAKEFLSALEQALPRAFESSFERNVVDFLESLVGERARERRAAVRLAQEAVTRQKGSGESWSSLRAISLDKPGEESSSSRSNRMLARPSLTTASDEALDMPTGKLTFPRYLLPVVGLAGAIVLGGLLSTLLRSHPETAPPRLPVVAAAAVTSAVAAPEPPSAPPSASASDTPEAD